MERFPQFKERGEKEIEMVEGMKKSIIALCEQMKTNFETGAYDAIVSDDTGGRIPALLISDIYKQVSKKKLPTLFVATGKGYRPKNEDDETALTEYLRNGIGGSKKVLLVTQYLRKGATTNHLIENLKKIGVESVEIATVEESPVTFKGSDAEALYVGGTLDARQGNFAENHTILSGISKSKEYNPMPMRLDAALTTSDVSRVSLMSLEEYKEFSGIGPYDSFEERIQKEKDAESSLQHLNEIQLSMEEREQIQENINRTRGIIKRISGEIVAELWPETEV